MYAKTEKTFLPNIDKEEIHVFLPQVSRMNLYAYTTAPRPPPHPFALPKNLNLTQDSFLFSNGTCSDVATQQ